MKSFKGHLYAMFSVLVWGSSFIFSKVLLQTLSPVALMELRFLVGYVTLLCMDHTIRPFDWNEEKKFILIGIIGTTVYYWAENTALVYTYAANVSILVSMAPLLTTILASVFYKDEVIGKNTWLGFLVAFAGVVFVVFNGRMVLNLSPLGDVLSFIAALSWALYSLILKQIMNNYPEIYLSRKIMFYGLLSGAIWMLVAKEPLGTEWITLPNIGLLLVLGVVGNALCYVAWNVANVQLGIVKCSAYIYMTPFITLVVGYLVLQEAISWMAVAGAVCIIAGMILSNRKQEE